MPNKNWSERSQARQVRISKERTKDKGILPYCRKCPAVEDCDCIHYDGRGMTDFWCADNPNEERVHEIIQA
jgi:hypothetical protein